MTSSSESNPRPIVFRSGFSKISGGADSKIDLVFLHGLNGHPETTWTHPGSRFFWPWELREILPDARIMTYGYDADITPQFGTNLIRIKSLAAGFLSSLVNERQEDSELSRPIVFVAHSLGGLIVKRALVIASQAQLTQNDDSHLVYEATCGLMFFGTPNAGSRVDEKKRVSLLQKIAKVAFTKVPPKLEEALKSHSDELLDLGEDFRRTSMFVNKNFEAYSFFETVTTAQIGDMVVDEFSALLHYDRETTIPVQSTHEGMVKFENKDNADFKNAFGKLKMIRRHALKSGQTFNQRGVHTEHPGDTASRGTPSHRRTVLCIDTGGQRTISSLLILESIMKTIQQELKLVQEPHPNEFFDLIGGSGTGGFAAVLLGRLRLGLSQVIKVLQDTLGKMAVKRGIMSWSQLKIFAPQYSADLVKNSVLASLPYTPPEVFAMGDRLLDRTQNIQLSKCFVCVNLVAQEGDAPSSAYARHGSQPLRSYQVGSEDGTECSITEAVKATMTFPIAMAPVKFDSGLEYVSGTDTHANPAFEALSEARRIWNMDVPGDILMVSLGAGSSDYKFPSPNADIREGIPLMLNSSCTLPDDAHRQLRMTFDPDHGNNYMRFNVGGSLNRFRSISELDFDKIRSHTTGYLGKPQTIRHIRECAERLIDCKIEKLLLTSAPPSIGLFLETNVVSGWARGISRDRVEQYLARRRLEINAVLRRAEQNISGLKENLKEMELRYATGGKARWDA